MQTSKRIGAYLRQQHLALVALFLVLAGGTAVAMSAPQNSVKSKSVKDNALRSQDLKDGAAVVGADVVENSIDGAAIDEQSLGQVGSAFTATQGGLGRYGFDGSCNPEGAAFVQCSSTGVFSMPAPGRVLVVATVRAQTEAGSDKAVGACRIDTDTPVLASLDRVDIDDDGNTDNQWESMSLVAVTDVLPVGNHSARVVCNQESAGAPVIYPQARVVAVGLSAG